MDAAGLGDVTSLTGRDGWVDLVGIDNLRDLGGLATANGVLRRSVLYRSSTPQAATVSDRRVVLEKLGIRTLIDLRTPQEIDQEGVGLLRADGISYRNFPFAGRGHLVRHLVPDATDLDLADFYLQLLDHGGAAVVSTVRLLTTDANFPAVIFCAAGKDRTGVLVAMLLDAVGVLREEIAVDYARTSERMVRVRARLMACPSYQHIGLIDDPLLRADTTTMWRFLDGLDLRHGGARNWLCSNGVTGQEIDTLRAVLTGPSGAKNDAVESVDT